MVRRWDRWRNPWDREYAMRGSLWRGVSSARPLVEAGVAPGRVLELGCGDGKYLAGLREAGFDAVGVDFSRRAVALARAPPGTAVVCGDVLRLPVRDASVRVVACRYVLGALLAGDRERAAAEVRRVAVEGGSVWVEEFGRGDFRYGSGREVEPHTFDRNRGILTHYFDADEVPALFPGWRVLVHAREVGTQRTRDGAKARERLRWLLESQGPS